MKNRIIISGGGTGGHIYPAIAIANELKRQNPDLEILFVGAKEKMEMQIVPKAGYDIVGLPVRGLQRKITFRNFITIWQLFISLIKSYRLINKFKPSAVVGVGGYASAPISYIASLKNIPVILQEQNSYPGITNKILSKRAKKICVAYNDMERFFEEKKLVLTGNPIRQDLLHIEQTKEDAKKYFNIEVDKKIISIIGGSLGARSLNESVLAAIDLIGKNKDIHIIWQTGSYYYNEITERMSNMNIPNLHVYKYLDRMDLVYKASDLIVSRAGACSISELALIEKSAILVPSPNVSEDHQTKNATALSSKGAAILIKDSDAKEQLISTAIETVLDEDKLISLSTKIKEFAMKDSAKEISEIIINEIK